MRSQLNVEIRDTVFDPNVSESLERKVHVQTKDNLHLYKVWIYLYGPDLPFVKAVTYHLHHTFPDALRRVERTVSNPSCQLVIWTWGLFTVRAILEDKHGGSYDVAYDLTYDKQLPPEESNYLHGQDR
jgi:hypothetical protein